CFSSGPAFVALRRRRTVPASIRGAAPMTHRRKLLESAGSGFADELERIDDSIHCRVRAAESQGENVQKRRLSRREIDQRARRSNLGSVLVECAHTPERQAIGCAEPSSNLGPNRGPQSRLGLERY